MARFRFRLDASLRLAEQKLDNARRALAEELRVLDDCVRRRDLQSERYAEGLVGKREDALAHPERLGSWQIYCTDQLIRLRELEDKVKLQRKAVEAARQRVYLAHQECEKFRRLKEKRWLAFVQEERRKEQAALDEAGQIISWRRKNAEAAG